MLPSYIKSASESVHQLYGTSEAQSYLDYLEELAHPTIYFVQYIMSRAASDIGDMSGVDWRTSTSITTNIGASITDITSTTSWTSWPLEEAGHREELCRVPHQAWCYLHRTTINGHQGHLQQFEEPVLLPDLHRAIILRYFRACPTTSEWLKDPTVDRAHEYNLPWQHDR